METVYLFLVDGFEEIEALTVVDVLRRAGIEIQTVSLTERDMVKGAHGITVKADRLFDDTLLFHASMLVLPGGAGTVHLAEHVGLTKMLSDFAASGGRLAAICAAPAVLGGLGLLNGKRATCFPGYENNLSGAVIQDLPVVTDGTVITGKAIGAAFDFSLAIVAELVGQEKAATVRANMYYSSALP